MTRTVRHNGITAHQHSSAPDRFCMTGFSAIQSCLEMNQCHHALEASVQKSENNGKPGSEIRINWHYYRAPSVESFGRITWNNFQSLSLSENKASDTLASRPPPCSRISSQSHRITEQTSSSNSETSVLPVCMCVLLQRFCGLHLLAARPLFSTL